MATVKREHLAKAVKRALPQTNSACAEIVDQVFEEIADGLKRDGRVLLSRFGAFVVHEKAERMGRNPKTMEPATITARKTVALRYSSTLVFRLNRDVRRRKQRRS